jgi:hypothetical protein
MKTYNPCLFPLVLFAASVTIAAKPKAPPKHHQMMPGMDMPMDMPMNMPKPEQPKPSPPAPQSASTPEATSPQPDTAPAQTPSAPPPSPPATASAPMSMPLPTPTPTPTPTPGNHDAPMADMPGMNMSDMNMAGMQMMQGEGSGTARVPMADAPMQGIHIHAGEWMVMLHGYAWGVYSDQGGPRGDHEAFVTSMAMASASRPLSSRTDLQLRGMFSLEPLMGNRGYPNLFASGETADGVPLVDRQHPHNAFMELSAKLTTDFGQGLSGFIYGGPVAEPALGPSAFMHRASAMLNPESPITHHWFDSTHISFGVVTAGVKLNTLQFEASAFRGREPSEQRWTIETPKLDSWSVRTSWSPTANWLASLSYGWLHSPEAQNPNDDESRVIAAISYGARNTAVTLGWSRKQHYPGNVLTAWLLEGNQDIGRHHSVFGRIENVANDELFAAPSPLAGTPYRVTKMTLGYAYRIPLGPVSLALGGSGSAYAKPSTLDAAYGSAPLSYTLFAKLSLGR